MVIMFKVQCRAFIIALQLLTVFPSPKLILSNSEWFLAKKYSLFYYSLVGVLLGLLTAFTGFVCTQFFSASLAASIVLLISVFMTGALHFDGLADCIDAFYAGHKIDDQHKRKNVIIQVMSDPRCGSMAVTFVCMTLFIFWSAIEVLLKSGLGYYFLCLLPILSRVYSMLLIVITPYAKSVYTKSSSLAKGPDLAEGSGLAQGLGVDRMILPLFLSLSACAIYMYALGVVFTGGYLLAFKLLGKVACVCLLMTGASLLWRWFLMRRLGGYTGDALGALIVCLELVGMLAAITLTF